MASTHTTAQATKPDGHHVVVQQTATDCPLLPAANLQQLAAIDPGLVQWVVDQTEAEANFRRDENRRINTLMFAERIVAVAAAALLAMSGFGVVVYLAMHGHDGVAAVIGGTTIVGIVGAVLARRWEQPRADRPGPQTPPARKRR